MKRLLVCLLLTLIAVSTASGIELRQIQPIAQQPAVSKSTVAPVLIPDILKVAIPPEAPALFVTLTQGKSYALKLSAKNFDLSKQLSFGEGIVMLDKPAMSGTEVTLNIKVNANAPVGKHAIVITSGTQPKTATAYLNVAAAPVQPVKIQPSIKPAAELPAKGIPTQPVSGAPKAVIILPPVKEPIKEIANLPLPPKPAVPVEGKKPLAPVAGPIKGAPRQLPVKDIGQLPPQKPPVPVEGKKPLAPVAGPIKGAPRQLPVKDIGQLPPQKPPVPIEGKKPLAPVAGPIKTEPRQLQGKDMGKLTPLPKPTVPAGGKKPLETAGKSEAAPAAKPVARPMNVVSPPPLPAAPLLPRPVYTMPAAPGQTVFQQARAGVPPAPADRVPAPGISSRRMREVSGYNFTGNIVSRSREVPNIDFAGSPVNYSRELLKIDFIGSP
ncbi:MAG: hypothetical protein ACYC69_15260 [Thermodesulfovibrionales bacterium]